jgi:hypothetical protein
VCSEPTDNQVHFDKGNHNTMTGAVWALVPILSVLGTMNAGEVKPVVASQIRGLVPARECP